MPGLLRDDNDSGNESSSSGDENSPPRRGHRMPLPRNAARTAIRDCLNTQEWLVDRYRHLRRELEDVDQQITRLRRNMELQAIRRQQYQNNLERALSASGNVPQWCWPQSYFWSSRFTLKWALHGNWINWYYVLNCGINLMNISSVYCDDVTSCKHKFLRHFLDWNLIHLPVKIRQGWQVVTAHFACSNRSTAGLYFIIKILLQFLICVATRWNTCHSLRALHSIIGIITLIIIVTSPNTVIELHNTPLPFITSIQPNCVHFTSTRHVFHHI